MPKIPRSIIVMYILMIIVLLGLCTGVFIVLFSNVTDDSQKSSSTSYPLIESSSSVSSSVSSSTSSSITESSSSTDVVFTSTESTESSTQSSSESSSSTTFVPGDTPSENFDLSFFADDLFIGDSIFTGFYLYPGYLEMSQVAAAVGLTPYKAYSSALDDKGVTAAEYAKQMQPKRIFIMLGSNAMAGTDHSSLEESYRELVSRLMGACPNAEICCISITPTARKNDYPNIDNSEVREVNRYIKSMCSELGLKYCDLYTLISDEDGYFLEDYA
ncbi:MAG: GDSL-type esterase/lipase family protein, partial [[Eubacterium] saphenum]|nr:GDSL-type esterase/lipase family protein [[Eubacterium] saphenum]